MGAGSHRRRAALVGAIVLFLAIGVVTWRSRPRWFEGPRPRVAVDTSRVEASETLIPLRPARFEFEIRNEGEGPLTLGRPESTRGRNSTRLESDTVAPGGSTRLIVDYEPRSPGRFRHTIRVDTNDPDADSLVFEFSGQARYRFEAQPRSLLVSSPPGKAPTVEILHVFFDPVHEQGGPEVRIEPFNAGFYFHKLTELATDRKRVFEIMFDPMEDAGEREAKLILESWRDRENIMEVKLKRIARHEAKMEPELLLLRTSAGGETARLTFGCRWDVGSTPIEGVEVEGEGFEVAGWRLDDSWSQPRLVVELRLPTRPGFHEAALRPRDGDGVTIAEALVGAPIAANGAVGSVSISDSPAAGDQDSR